MRPTLILAGFAAMTAHPVAPLAILARHANRHRHSPGSGAWDTLLLSLVKVLHQVGFGHIEIDIQLVHPQDRGEQGGRGH